MLFIAPSCFGKEDKIQIYNNIKHYKKNDIRLFFIRPNSLIRCLEVEAESINI